jgi:hypothetical protein
MSSVVTVRSVRRAVVVEALRCGAAQVVRRYVVQPSGFGATVQQAAEGRSADPISPVGVTNCELVRSLVHPDQDRVGVGHRTA